MDDDVDGSVPYTLSDLQRAEREEEEGEEGGWEEECVKKTKGSVGKHVRERLLERERESQEGERERKEGKGKEEKEGERHGGEEGERENEYLERFCRVNAWYIRRARQIEKVCANLCVCVFGIYLQVYLTHHCRGVAW